MRSRNSKIVVFFGIPTALAVFLLLSVNYFGYVWGYEISPVTLKRRRFHYYEIPLLEIQLFSVKHRDADLPTVRYLNSAALLPASSGEDRWDLTNCLRGTSTVFDGDADILVQHLEARNKNGKRIWIEWSQAAPKTDSLYLWDTVVTISQRQLYILLPDVFAAARDAEPQQVKAKVNGVLLPRYCQLALIKENEGEHQQAIELYEFALELDADYQLAQEGKARNVKAAADP